MRSITFTFIFFSFHRLPKACHVTALYFLQFPRKKQLQNPITHTEHNHDLPYRGSKGTFSVQIHTQFETDSQE